MTPANFDWFLHAMLSYHTVKVLAKQAPKDDSDSDDSESSSDGDDT